MSIIRGTVPLTKTKDPKEVQQWEKFMLTETKLALGPMLPSLYVSSE